MFDDSRKTIVYNGAEYSLAKHKPGSVPYARRMTASITSSVFSGSNGGGGGGGWKQAAWISGGSGSGGGSGSSASGSSIARMDGTKIAIMVT